MTDRETTYSGLSNAAWGYFLLHVDFNLGPVSILPAFAGYLLLLSAIGKLSKERRDLALLRPLGLVLAGWNALAWLLSWGGGKLEKLLPPVDLLAGAAALYFHFQFLTDMAALAGAYQPEGSGLDRRLLHRRTAYIVLTTAISVLMHLPMNRSEDVWTYVLMGFLAAALVVTLLIMGGLFELRRLLREGQEEQPNP